MEQKVLKKAIYSCILLCVTVILAYATQNTNVAVFNTKVFSPSKKLPIYCVETREKKVALTFDASWGNDKTDEIAEILDKYNVKATFFLVGAWVDEHPDKLKMLSDKGHEIGNHSNKHPDMTKISREKIIEDININNGKIMKITGNIPKLFRCPSGSYNDLVITTVESMGHYCIQWDVDSIDWKGENADLEYSRVVKKVKSGSIVLFHNDAKNTPKNLPRIIENLKSQGYEFVTVGQLIYKENYQIDYSGKQVPIIN